MVRLFICILFIPALLSCGKQKFPDYEDNSDLQREEQEAGVYGAKFVSLNPQASGNIRAHAVLWTRGNQFYVRVIQHSRNPRVRHQQFIHKGGRCPQSTDDRNGDNKIDYAEAVQSSGEMLIPLDRSLKTQAHGNEWFPTSDSAGTFNYSRSVGIHDLLIDLRANDPNPDDMLGKLDAGENLEVDQRTIIIYGTSTDPMLPIACAEIYEEFE